MKYLVFVFVIAFILRDYGTLQTRSTPEQVVQFKKYVVNLVSAAVPVLYSNTKLMDGGYECSLYSDENNLTPIDTVWTTMAMAKEYSETIAAIKNAEDVSTVEISDGMSEYIRRIMVVLRTPPEEFELATEQRIIEKYVLQIPPDGTNPRESQELPAPKCALTVLSFPFRTNGHFFWGVYRGLEIASALVLDNVAYPDGDPRGRDLNKIVVRLNKHKLRTPDEKYQREGFEVLRKWLNGEKPEERRFKCGST